MAWPLHLWLVVAHCFAACYGKYPQEIAPNKIPVGSKLKYFSVVFLFPSCLNAGEIIKHNKQNHANKKDTL